MVYAGAVVAPNIFHSGAYLWEKEIIFQIIKEGLIIEPKISLNLGILVILGVLFFNLGYIEGTIKGLGKNLWRKWIDWDFFNFFFIF